MCSVSSCLLMKNERTGLKASCSPCWAHNQSFNPSFIVGTHEQKNKYFWLRSQKLKASRSDSPRAQSFNFQLLHPKITFSLIENLRFSYHQKGVQASIDPKGPLHGLKSTFSWPQTLIFKGGLSSPSCGYWQAKPQLRRPRPPSCR